MKDQLRTLAVWLAVAFPVLVLLAIWTPSDVIGGKILGTAFLSGLTSLALFAITYDSWDEWI